MQNNPKKGRVTFVWRKMGVIVNIHNVFADFILVKMA